MPPERDAAPAEPGPYAWYMLAVLVLVYVANYVDRQLLTILAPELKRDLGISDAEFGFLYGTAFGVFYALFGIPLGRLADRWSRTRLLALGLTVWSLTTALSGLSRSFAQIAAARVGVGIGEATAAPCAYSLIGDYFPPHRRATALLEVLDEHAQLAVSVAHRFRVGGELGARGVVERPVEAHLRLWVAVGLVGAVAFDADAEHEQRRGVGFERLDDLLRQQRV